jgi:hypothetical protein
MGARVQKKDKGSRAPRRREKDKVMMMRMMVKKKKKKKRKKKGSGGGGWADSQWLVFCVSVRRSVAMS